LVTVVAIKNAMANNTQVPAKAYPKLASTLQLERLIIASIIATELI
jgi:hypothetical protein